MDLSRPLVVHFWGVDFSRHAFSQYVIKRNFFVGVLVWIAFMSGALQR